MTLQPIDRYEGLLDAAIIFSDILVVPQAMGLQVEMPPDQGPLILEPLITPKDLRRLKNRVNVHEDLKHTFDAITLTRHALEGRVPLIGFAGGPWTLMVRCKEHGFLHLSLPQRAFSPTIRHLFGSRTWWKALEAGRGLESSLGSSGTLRKATCYCK